jgi:hypothetical protein
MSAICSCNIRSIRKAPDCVRTRTSPVCNFCKQVHGVPHLAATCTNRFGDSLHSTDARVRSCIDVLLRAATHQSRTQYKGMPNTLACTTCVFAVAHINVPYERSAHELVLRRLVITLSGGMHR